MVLELLNKLLRKNRAYLQKRGEIKKLIVFLLANSAVVGPITIASTPEL